MSDWPDLARGFYAVEVTHDGDVIGWALFERQTPRITKTGRRMGRNCLRVGAKYAVDDAHVGLIQRLSNQHQGEWIDQVADAPLAAQKLYGTVTGRCGCCGKKLTDATSKLLGIGPDCRRELAKTVGGTSDGV